MRSTPWTNWTPSILFWGAVGIVLLYFAAMLVWVGIIEFYHPMSARGHVGMAWFPTFATVALAVVVGVIVWVWRMPTRHRTHAQVVGAGLLVLILGTHLLSLFIQTDYHQTYWLRDVRHEIPWRYSPRSGSPDPGGSFLVVEVVPRDFAPRYDGPGSDAVMLVKATDFEFGESSRAPEAVCVERSGNVRCSERRGRFVYEIAGKAEDLPSNPASMLDRAQSLLDGFESRP